MKQKKKKKKYMWNEIMCKVSLRKILEKKEIGWQRSEIMQIWFRWQMVFAGKGIQRHLFKLRH